MYMQGPELDAQNSYKMHGVVESTSIPSPKKEDTGGWDSLASKSVLTAELQVQWGILAQNCNLYRAWRRHGCQPLLLPQVHIHIHTHKPRHTYILTGMHSWLCIYTQIFRNRKDNNKMGSWMLGISQGLKCLWIVQLFWLHFLPCFESLHCGYKDTHKTITDVEVSFL